MAKVQKDKTRNSKTKEKEVIRNGVGKFLFANGDCYEGEYLALNDVEIYRHGGWIYSSEIY